MSDSREPGLVAADWPAPVAMAVKVSAVIGYGLALAGLILGLTGGDLSAGLSWPRGVVVMCLLAVPATLAILSHPQRPLMLLPAAMIGFAGLFGALSILGLPLIVLAAIWFWADVKLTPRGSWMKRVAMIVVPLLWLAAAAALWVHVDPACEQRLADGTVVDLDPASRSMESGWVWQVGDTSSGSAESISNDVVYEVCDSDVVVAWEVALAVLFSGAAVLYAYWTAAPPVSSSRSADDTLRPFGQ